MSSRNYQQIPATSTKTTMSANRADLRVQRLSQETRMSLAPLILSLQAVHMH
ncbi:hypothetical protein J6590_102447, partial [Homalodisca vitripennis]